MLFERQDLSAVPALVKTVRESKVALARMHALYALDGLGALKVEQVKSGLADESPWVRKHAVRLAEPLLREAAENQNLVSDLRSRVDDPDPEVRRQLAFSIGEFEGSDRVALLSELIHAHPTDPWLQVGVLSSLASRAGDFFAAISRDSEWFAASETRPFLRQLVLMDRRASAAIGMEQVMGCPCSRKFDFPGVRIRKRPRRRSPASGQFLDEIYGALSRIAPLVTRAQTLAADSQADVSARSQAVRFLAQARLMRRPATFILLRPGQPVELQKAALTTFASYSDPEVAADLLGLGLN